VISENELTILVVQTGCGARRDERHVAGHTNEEQRGSAPVCAATMVWSFSEVTLVVNCWRQTALADLNGAVCRDRMMPP